MGAQVKNRQLVIRTVEINKVGVVGKIEACQLVVRAGQGNLIRLAGKVQTAYLTIHAIQLYQCGIVAHI
jgi:hypothetical protein